MPTKVCLVKAMVFPVVMYGCESWTVKKAECQRIDAFELWCWRRLLKVPWPARRSNQSILKEISSEYSLGRLMLKLKLQYFGHLMRRADSFCRSHAFWETNSLRRTMQMAECSLLPRRAQGRVSSQPRTPTRFCENLMYPKYTCSNPPPRIPLN